MDTRETKLDISLDEQVLLERVQASEALGTPFVISVDIISELTELDLLKHLGKTATISIYQDGEFQRYFHGVLTEGEFTHLSNSGFHYRLILRPWTYWLSQNCDFSIYQELDAKEIIKKVLEEANATDVDFRRLSRRCAKRTYCVQYGESDFAFISRLMEEEGIYYFFRHEEDRHVMVLCDGPSSHVTGEPQKLIFMPTTASVFNTDANQRGAGEQDHYLQVWCQRVMTGGEAKVTLRDFDFEKPEQPLETISETSSDHQDDTIEVYRYPGGYSTVENGEKLGAVALQAVRTERVLFRGESQASSISCGLKLAVEGNHNADLMDGNFVIVRTMHSITAERYRSGRGELEQPYNVAFEAIPAATTWQTPQVTPRPVICGLETAIVTGPEGEEIYTDEYGRVKVRFHWDRGKTPGEKSTCWIRVSQTGGLGNIILPRVGHEVLIDFLAGNPDRPVVVGRVYNKSNMPIYALPEHKTRALWRTKTYGPQSDYGNAKSLDTGAPLANELRFEDKGGKEEVFLHAERDLTTRVRHKETHHVGCDQEVKVRNDRSVLVESNETIDVKKNRKATIGVDDKLEVGKNLTIKAGTNIEIEAGASITIKVGGSIIKMDPSSIKVESAMVSLDGKATLDAKSPMTCVKGTATLVLNGGLVKIN